jgi:hypothetical protein
MLQSSIRLFATSRDGFNRIVAHSDIAVANQKIINPAHTKPCGVIFDDEATICLVVTYIVNPMHCVKSIH